MAKLNAKVGAIKDKDGNAVDPVKRSAGNGRSFEIIPDDYYLAVVKTLTFGEYRAQYKGVKSKAKDGKWTYWKVTPSVELLNDNRTIINRQDIQIGVVDNGSLVRPDGDDSKSAIWTGAQYFLGALGLLTQDENGEFSIGFDPDIIANRVVKVRTGIGGYIKGERGFDVNEMKALLTEQNNGMEYTFDEIPFLVDQWNEDNGYDDPDIRLKTKNIITNYFAVDLATVEERGFYLDEATGAVYVTELDYNKYQQLVDMEDNYEEPDF